MPLSWHLAHLSRTCPTDRPWSTNGVVYHHGSKLTLVALLRELLLGIWARKPETKILSVTSAIFFKQYNYFTNLYWKRTVIIRTHHNNVLWLIFLKDAGHYILAARHAALRPAFHISRWVHGPSLWIALHPLHHGALRRTTHSSLHHISWWAATLSHEWWVPLLVHPCMYNNEKSHGRETQKIQRTWNGALYQLTHHNYLHSWSPAVQPGSLWDLPWDCPCLLVLWHLEGGWSPLLPPAPAAVAVAASASSYAASSFGRWSSSPCCAESSSGHSGNQAADEHEHFDLNSTNEDLTDVNSCGRWMHTTLYVRKCWLHTWPPMPAGCMPGCMRGCMAGFPPGACSIFMPCLVWFINCQMTESKVNMFYKDFFVFSINVTSKTKADLLHFNIIIWKITLSLILCRCICLCDHLLSLQSLLQLQSERLCGSHHARSHHIRTWVAHAWHAREAPCLAHLIHYGGEATRRLALYCVATITRLNAHRRWTWGPRVALVIHGFLVHA